MQRRALVDKDEAASSQRFKSAQVFRFIGQLQQALDTAAISSPSGDLAQAITRLDERTRELRQSLNPEQRRQRTEFALGRISRTIEAHAASLNLEHSKSEVALDIQELTLRFRNPQGRRDFLWEIGSGQNWVGYHVATLLALHEWFASIPGSPVPSLLVVDQPSQVYFPEAWPSVDAPPDTPGKSALLVSADIEGVRRIFAALSETVSRLRGHFQVIVTEHAGEITWSGLPNVNLVGNWRRGHDEFLIPDVWLSGAADGS
jgi:hypothetical protein